ncbi:MAG: hypothetical protein AAGI63_03605 [Planctomycetota bacterium]
MNRSSNNRRPWTFAAVWIVTILSMITPAFAERMFPKTLDPLNLPQVNGTARGFRATIEISQSSSVGYVPVSIAIKSQGTVTADRNLIFRFETIEGGYYPPRNGMTVDIPITLGQGTKGQTEIHYLPHWCVGRAFNVSVIEDDSVLTDYEGQIGVSNVARLSIRDVMPREVRGDQLIVRAEQERTKSIDAVAAERIANTRTLQTTELASDWRAYQGLDLIVMSVASLGELKNQPSLSAIRAWVMQGGTLLILDAEDVETAFDLVGVSFDPNASLDNYLQSKSLGSLPYQAGLDQELRIQPQNAILTELSRSMTVASVGGGQVLAITSDVSGNTSLLLTVLSQTNGFRNSPLLRRGVDPMLGNRRFFEWMIPGVAQPPVYTFMGLLTLFVILVGPIAYRRTAKVGRSYLMFIIAPLLAIATTIAMFTYGIVSDGFGTLTRVRQLTWVDGASGEAAERVRATYFAGIRPTEGLTFLPDAEVFAFQEGTGIAWEQLSEIPSATLGTVTLQSDKQAFSSSFLPSRQQRQFVTFLPRPKIGSLSLTPAANGLDAPTVSNGFDFALRSLILRDPGGEYWMVDELGPGQSAMCKPAEQVSKKLGNMYTDYVPVAQTRQASGQARRNRRFIYDLLYRINEEVDRRVAVSNGVFETWLQQQLQTVGEIPPSHFIAFSDVTEDVLAVKECEVTESIRYVFGTMQ